MRNISLSYNQNLVYLYTKKFCVIVRGKTESIKMQKGKAMRGKIPSALSSCFDLGFFDVKKCLC